MGHSYYTLYLYFSPMLNGISCDTRCGTASAVTQDNVPAWKVGHQWWCVQHLQPRSPVPEVHTISPQPPCGSPRHLWPARDQFFGPSDCTSPRLYNRIRDHPSTPTVRQNRPSALIARVARREVATVGVSGSWEPILQGMFPGVSGTFHIGHRRVAVFDAATWIRARSESDR